MSEEYERYSLDIAKYILIALQILGGNASRQEIKEKFVEDTQFDLTYHEVFEPYTGKTYSHFLFDFNFGLIALKCCNYIEPYKRNSNIILTQKGKNFNAQLYPTDEDKEIQQDYWQKAHNKKSNEQAFINWCTNHKQLKNSNKLYSESSAKDFTFMLKKQLCKKIPEIEKEINSQNIFIITDYELIDAILNKYLSEIDNIDKLANNADGKNSLILYSEFLKGNNCENPIEQLETYNKGNNMESAKYHPLNQILYGPPGTGKTYNTVIKAMEIITFENLFRKWFIEIYCKNKNVKDSEKTLKDYVTHIKKINEEYLINDNIFKYYDIASFKQLQTNILNSSYVLKNDTRNNPNSYYQHSLKRYEEFLYWLDYEKIRKEFDALKQQGQIEFVTFHQSYSYEEFVEGIKPDISKWNDDGSDIKYVGKDGIFKNIAKKALFSHLNILASDDEKFKNIIKCFIDDNSEGSKFKTQYSEFEIVRYTQTAIIVEPCNGKTEYNLTFNNLEKLYRNKQDVKTRKDIEQILGWRGLSTYYLAILNKLKDYSEKNITNIQTNSNEDSIIIKSIDDYLQEYYEGNLTLKEEPKKYILIIDEINRGDVSKIFGELITLIEEDKRIGKDHQMTVTLPYSREPFGVPNNLYIIGTMNTADRSIALLDTALRRRFDFEEMMPKPELLRGKDIEGVDLEQLLTKINDRIKNEYDRDHQIGHSYLMGVKNKEQLERAYKNRILPLLNEYFYNDIDSVAKILNCKPNDVSSKENWFNVLKEAQKSTKKDNEQ